MDEKLDSGMTHVWAIWNYVEALILIAAGVLAIVFCNNTDLQGIFSYAIGAFVILDGLLRFIMAVVNYKKSQENIMLVSSFELTLGTVIIMVESQSKGFFVGLAIQFLSIFLIALGTLFLAYSIIAIACKRVVKLTMPILEIIFSAVLIGLGIFVLIANNNKADWMQAAVMVVMGIIVAVVGGAIAVITTINILKKKKSAQREVVATPIAKDANVMEVKAEDATPTPIEHKPEEGEVIDGAPSEEKPTDAE